MGDVPEDGTHVSSGPEMVDWEARFLEIMKR